jgi:hypothetical protein
MNRARLLALGFNLGARAAAGRSQGAWFATARDGSPVVLKWSPGEAMAGRYAALLPGLDELRARGVPVPEYLHVGEFDGGTLSAILHHPTDLARQLDRADRVFDRYGV